MPDPTTPASLADPAALARQLEEVSRREAWFRLQTIQTFQELDRKLKAAEARADQLSEELGTRNQYVHELHLAQAQWREALQAGHADLALFAQWLHAAEDENQSLRRQIARLRRSWGWKLAAPLRALQKRFGGPSDMNPPALPIAPAGPFVYYLYDSPFRVYRTEQATVRGWLFPEGDGRVTGIRLRVSGHEYHAEIGQPDAEVVEHHRLAGTPHERPGFTVSFALQPGRQLWQLEAQLDHGPWLAVLTTPVWCLR